MNNKEHIKDINDSRVFIVEDNDMHSLMMDYFLSKDSTTHIKRFNSGEECIQNLNLNPDVVILDYGLPGINGMQTLNAIREYDPKIPVIIITGNMDRNIARKFLDAGVYDYIQKQEDAFEEVSKVADKILNIMSDKEEDKRRNSRNLLISIGIMIATLVIATISFLTTRH
ncbi:MAG TPA: response regulator [Bacteroidia bacterium]|nr:response regulator [Bacteroidia bacterium]